MNIMGSNQVKLGNFKLPGKVRLRLVMLDLILIIEIVSSGCRAKLYHHLILYLITLV